MTYRQRRDGEPRRPHARGTGERRVEPDPATTAAAPDPYAAACPSRALLARIGEKWATLIVAELQGGPRRFGALHRRLEGVSQKMLTQTLRNLERDGLLTRTLLSDRPIEVSYALTARGESLAAVVDALKEWARLHYLDVAREQHRYDAAHGTRGQQP